MPLSATTLSHWINDQLYLLLGYSDSTVCDYLIDLATKAVASKSSHSITAYLLDCGISRDSCAQFVGELMTRVANSSDRFVSANPQATSVVTSLSAAQSDRHPSHVSSQVTLEQLEREKKRHLIELHRRNAKYSLVLDDTRNAMTSNLILPHPASTIQPSSITQSEDSLRQIEKHEIVEFEKRLKNRDDKKTKKVNNSNNNNSSKYDKLESKDESSDFVDDSGLSGKAHVSVSALRHQARINYLTPREEKKIQELQDELKDEEYLFFNKNNQSQLTDLEKKRYEINKKILEIAKGKLSTDSKNVLTGEQGLHQYQIPDAMADEIMNQKEKEKKYLSSANQRYVSEAVTVDEQSLWEGKQATMAVAHYGSLDKVKSEKTEKAYDMIMEEEIIDFISNEILKGSDPTKLIHAHPSSADVKDSSLTPYQQIQLDRKSLPIFPYRDELLTAIAEYQCLIIVGETGSGKTTQTMQYLYEAGYGAIGHIGCTQPRRVAAMSVAKRVADEMGVKLGDEVGYSIRFEDCTSEKTVIKYMTDGMLLREFLSEPDLASYSVIMLDEAHERTLHTDILFGLIKDIMKFRRDIKILISSATLDAEKFSQYFTSVYVLNQAIDDKSIENRQEISMGKLEELVQSPAPIFNIPGRRFPVSIFYTKAPEANYIDAAIITVLQIHYTQPLPGDILVFLPGQEEIEQMNEDLNNRIKLINNSANSSKKKNVDMIISPIYANLPSDLQAKIFDPTPTGSRKVVLATNIAETSITIDGIAFVIDPGFCKQNSYNPRTGMSSLVVTPISKAMANQRAGRAGRVGPGKCFRLYTSWSYNNELDDNTVPEIQRTNLSNVVLMLKSLGINDLINFDFMDAPPSETLIRALEQLYAVGALNNYGELTKVGRKMAEFPIDPMMSKSVIMSETYGVVEEVITIMSMLSVNSAIFYRPKDKKMFADTAHQTFFSIHGDHLTLLNIFNAWMNTGYSIQWCYENFIQYRSLKHAREIREQLINLCGRCEVEVLTDVNNITGIMKSITSGFFYHTAKLQRTGNYRTIKNPQTVYIHPSSSIIHKKSKYLLYHELVFTSKEYMRCVMEINQDWLIELAPHYYKKKDIDDLSTTHELKK